MQEENNMYTEMTYKALLEMLDERGWKYRKEGEHAIFCVAQGDDLPMPLKFEVDDKRKLLLVFSQLPFDVPVQKRVNMAIAVSFINFAIVDGSFDFSFLNGTLLFRLTSSYRESIISKELLEYMLMVTFSTVDACNDKFERVAKEDLTRDEIIALFK